MCVSVILFLLKLLVFLCVLAYVTADFDIVFAQSVKKCETALHTSLGGQWSIKNNALAL